LAAKFPVKKPNNILKKGKNNSLSWFLDVILVPEGFITKVSFSIKAFPIEDVFSSIGIHRFQNFILISFSHEEILIIFFLL